MYDPNKKIKMRDIHYYFDGVMRDSKDVASLGDRIGRWLNVRRKLMMLPQDSYEGAMGAIEAVVEKAFLEHIGEGPNEDSSSQHKRGQKLFNDTRAKR